MLNQGCTFLNLQFVSCLMLSFIYFIFMYCHSTSLYQEHEMNIFSFISKLAEREFQSVGKFFTVPRVFLDQSLNVHCIMNSKSNRSSFLRLIGETASCWSSSEGYPHCRDRVATPKVPDRSKLSDSFDTPKDDRLMQ